jgi:hypothetical protein
MSLASSFRGPGASAGGVPALMAPRTNAVARAAPRTTHENIKAMPGSSSTAPPMNLNAIAAELLDKNQQLTVKSIKTVSSYPIVAIDLYGDGDSMEVAYYPPRNEQDSKVTIVTSDDSVDRKLPFKVLDKDLLSASEKNSNLLALQREHEPTYKLLRKMIQKGVRDPALTSTLVNPSSNADMPCIVIPKPQYILGARSSSAIHSAVKEALTKNGITEQESSPAIAEELYPESGVCIIDGTLDGSTSPSNNAFDRVLFQLKLKSDRKALTFLPEELVSIMIEKCKKGVYNTWEKDTKNKSKKQSKSKETEDDDEEEQEESYLEYPTAIAVPAWALYDEHMEALLEACDKNVGSVFYQRSVAAMVGALVSRRVTKKVGSNVVDDVEIPKLLDKLSNKWAMRNKIADGRPIVVVCGLTDIGIELSAIQLDQVNSQGGIQSSDIDAQCPFRDFKVLSSVALCHSDPVSVIGDSLKSLIKNIHSVMPELIKTDGLCVDAFVTFGSIAKQLALKEALLSSLRSVDSTFSGVWNDKIDFFSTREDVVVIGASVLAAVSHERILMAPIQGSNDSGKKTHGKKDVVVKPAIDVHNVSTTRLLLSIHIGGKASPPKMLFDFDQRVPSTSMRIEFSAAECVALMKDLSLWNNPDKLHEESLKWSGSKYSGLREEAAQDISFTVYQIVDRSMHKVTVGNPSFPLRADKDGKIVAVESSYVEFKVNAMGMLTQCMVSSS